MKRVYKNNKRMQKRLDKCRQVYLVVKWAKYGVVNYHYTGRFVLDHHNSYVPEVYYHYDCNGMVDEWHRAPITSTTVGGIVTYTFNKHKAELIARAFNTLLEREVEHGAYTSKLDSSALAFNIGMVLYSSITSKEFKDAVTKIRNTLTETGVDIPRVLNRRE